MQLSYNGHNPFLEQAALWATVLEEEDTVAHRAAFGRWLKESPDHVEAVLLLAAAVHEAHRFKALRQQLQRMATLTTLAPVEASNEASLTPILPIRQRPRRWIWALLWVPTLSAALLLFVAVLPTVHTQPRIERTTAASHAKTPDRVIDEAGFVALGPQSLMRVEADSRVRDHILPDGAGHEIAILDGAAYFSGQHGPGNYLRVRSGRLTVEVLGTEFKVQNRAGRTAISVFRGAVQVIRCEPLSAGSQGEAQLTQGSPSEPPATPLKANQIATASSETCVGTLAVKNLPAAQSTPQQSSEDGGLIFHDTPVDQAAEMFNRANTHYLIVVDEAVAKVRIGGTFRTSDLDGFIEGLQALGVHVRRHSAASEGTVIYLIP